MDYNEVLKWQQTYLPGTRIQMDPYNDKFQRLPIDDQILEAEVLRDEFIAKKHQNRERDGFDGSDNLDDEEYPEQKKHSKKGRDR